MRPATRRHRKDLDQLATVVGRQVAAAAGGPDVGDIDAWWGRRVGPITDAVAAGYGRGVQLGAGYLLVDAADAGVTLDPVRPTVNLGMVEASMRINGPVQFKKAIGRGMDPDTAARRMVNRLVATGQRHALGGARDTVERTIQAARVILGYRRVTAAGACDFCQMLASRGAVYKSTRSAGTVTGDRGGRPRGNAKVGASFHNHCRCTVEPIYGEEAAYIIRPLTEAEQDRRRQASVDRLRGRAAALAERKTAATAAARRAAARAEARAGNARRRLYIEQARSRALEAQRVDAVGSGKVPAELLERYGVTESQFLNARGQVKAIQADIREAARREADSLAAWLDDSDLARLNRPDRLRQTVDPISGRRRMVRDQSGYDWLEGLDEATTRQVRRRFDDDPAGLYAPDVVAEQVRRVTNQDMTDDEAMDWLVDRWLHADGLRSIASGRVPRYVDADTILPEAYGGEGYSLARLFAAEADDAAGHVAQVQAEAAEGYARRTLGQPRNGPAPWEMDAADYVAELDEVESILATAADYDPASRRWAEDRIRELAPPDLDAADVSNPYELWHRIRLTAQTARLIE